MSNRLIRFLLAICVAFVFSGQVEASARHCAQKAAAVAPVDDDATTAAHKAPCHGDAADAAPAETEHPSRPSPANAPADAPCECAAMLKTTALPGIERASVRVDHLDWAPIAADRFVSADREADLRPPRA